MKYDPVTTGLRASETVEIMQDLQRVQLVAKVLYEEHLGRGTGPETISSLQEINETILEAMRKIGMAAIGSDASVAIIKVVHTGGAKGNLFFGIHRTKAEADEALKESHMEGFVAPLHSPSVIPE